MKQSLFPLLSLFLAFVGSEARATADLEALRVKQRVTYENGDFIEASCQRKEICKLDVGIGGTSYRLPAAKELSDTVWYAGELLMIRSSTVKDGFLVRYPVICAPPLQDNPHARCYLYQRFVKNKLEDQYRETEFVYSVPME